MLWRETWEILPLKQWQATLSHGLRLSSPLWNLSRNLWPIGDRSYRKASYSRIVGKTPVVAPANSWGTSSGSDIRLHKRLPRAGLVELRHEWHGRSRSHLSLFILHLQQALACRTALTSIRRSLGKEALTVLGFCLSVLSFDCSPCARTLVEGSIEFLEGCSLSEYPWNEPPSCRSPVRDSQGRAYAFSLWKPTSASRTSEPCGPVSVRE